MNKRSIQQIFTNYIKRFAELTDPKTHNENYKWFAPPKFRPLMDEALQTEGEAFSEAFRKVWKETSKSDTVGKGAMNLIDNYTQPFGGMVELAKREPNTVRQMYLNLFANDGGDAVVRGHQMQDFLQQSQILLEKYFPDSFRYKQDMRAISGYLFLYDTDHQYMYKANDARFFADCIEFYDDWGSGANLKLDVYYRMCDWIVEQIMECDELLAVDASRFKQAHGKEMYEDANKHMLVYDLIYCCHYMNLFDGIPLNTYTSKEKKQIIELRGKALDLLAEYEKAVAHVQQWQDARELFKEILIPGAKAQHKKYGAGEVMSYLDTGASWIVTIKFTDGTARELGVPIFGSGLLVMEDEQVEDRVRQYADVLQREKSTLQSAVSNAEQNLEPYKKYLEGLA